MSTSRVYDNVLNVDLGLDHEVRDGRSSGREQEGSLDGAATTGWYHHTGTTPYSGPTTSYFSDSEDEDDSTYYDCDTDDDDFEVSSESDDLEHEDKDEDEDAIAEPLPVRPALNRQFEETHGRYTCALQTPPADFPTPPPSFPLRNAVFTGHSRGTTVIPIPLNNKSSSYTRDVAANKEQRGLRVSDLHIHWNDHRGVASTCADCLLVQLAAERECFCEHLAGPTVRISPSGREWPGAVVSLPDRVIPAKDLTRGGPCISFDALLHAAVEEFLTWWFLEKKERMNRSVAGDSRAMSTLGPWSVELDDVYVVGIDARHLALGVHEWYLRMEVRL